MIGECFFEINSRGENSETRTIYFTNNTEAKRLRSNYVMKEFANGVLNKNYIEATVSSLTDVHTMAFVLDGEFVLVVINDNENSISNVPINLNGLHLVNDVQEFSWSNTLLDEGAQSIITKENANLFKVNLSPKSINIYTPYVDNSLSAEIINNKKAINVFPIPISDDIIHVTVINFQDNITFLIIDLSNRVVKKVG